jgi:hypothetical protein
MKCEEFKSTLAQEDSNLSRPLSEGLTEHYESCVDCQSFIQEEKFWQRFFAAAPEAIPTKSLWPGIASRIREQLERRESFSTLFVLLGRRLAPAFTLLLILIAGGVFLWAPTIESQDANISIITMVENGSGRLGPLSEEPDAILNSWLGANQR